MSLMTLGWHFNAPSSSGNTSRVTSHQSPSEMPRREFPAGHPMTTTTQKLLAASRGHATKKKEKP
jgi:hypothetical protein